MSNNDLNEMPREGETSELTQSADSSNVDSANVFDLPSEVEEVNLLAVEFDAPKRRERAYDAKQVDEVMRAVQDQLDSQVSTIHRLIARIKATPAASPVVAKEEVAPEVIGDTEITGIIQNADDGGLLVSELMERVDTLTEENRVLKELSEQREVKDVGAEAAGILRHAATIAENSLLETRHQAEAMIRDAEKKVADVKKSAEDAIVFRKQILESLHTLTDGLNRVIADEEAK